MRRRRLLAGVLGNCLGGRLIDIGATIVAAGGGMASNGVRDRC